MRTLWYILGLLVLTNAQLLTIETFQSRGITFKDIADAVITGQVRNGISVGCTQQITSLFDSNNSRAFWQMADSWSIFPYTGAFLYATKYDFGNYEECTKIEVNTDNERILGKYCPWGWMLPDLRTNESAPYLLTYCVPELCQAIDLNNIVRSILPELKKDIFDEQYCSTKDNDTEIDTGAIVAMIIFGLIFILMLLSTAFDVYLFYAGKKSPSPIFLAFSIYSNGKKLLTSSRTSRAGDQILCFNGMKFISMWWIISGHGFLALWLQPATNKDFKDEWLTMPSSRYIASAHISVDTFFYISGFLMAYMYFKQELSKGPIWQQIKAVPLLILHRYLRITPANAMCFLGSVYLFKYLQTGPFFSYGIRTGLVEPCKEYWWTYFLYIQNYYNFHFGDSLCIPTTWYLSADFQLFLVTPLIIIPLTVLYRRSFRATMAALVGLNLVFFGIPIFARLQWRDYDPKFLEYDFHSKLITYFIGIMMGIYMRHEKNKKVVISKTLNVCLWSLALATMLGVIFYRQEVQIKKDYVGKSLCYSFTRPIWCLALSWITYACAKGYGGMVNWFLSCSFMQLGGKLTYCIYIVHGMVILHYSLGLDSKVYFSDWAVFYDNCGHFIVSMLIATLWTLAFESPMITIEKLIFGTARSSVPKPPQIESKVA